LQALSGMGEDEDLYKSKTDNIGNGMDISNLARKVAEDERFQNAKNRNQRNNAAFLIAGDEFNKDPMARTQLIQKAKFILDVEIKPKKENDLKEIIQKLKSEGYSIQEISLKLGIQWAKVNKYF
jgi:hypothetical protein